MGLESAVLGDDSPATIRIFAQHDSVWEVAFLQHTYRKPFIYHSNLQLR